MEEGNAMMKAKNGFVKKLRYFCLIGVITLGLLSFTMLTGCGKDGDYGQSFIAIDWVYSPQSYWDNNSAVPYVFYAGQYYNSQPGTYDFQYTAWDGSSYSGLYTITVDEGEDAPLLLLFVDGEDGVDKYFTLWLFSFGPSFYQTRSILEKEASKGLDAGLDESDNTDTLSKSDMPDEALISSFDSDVIVIEKQQGRYKMRVEYRKVSY